jgi:hypothetical protein
MEVSAALPATSPAPHLEFPAPPTTATVPVTLCLSHLSKITVLLNKYDQSETGTYDSDFRGNKVS